MNTLRPLHPSLAILTEIDTSALGPMGASGPMTKDISTSALEERGLTTSLKSYMHEGRRTVGIELTLEDDPKEPLLIFLNRVKKTWKNAGSSKPFPTILFVNDADMVERKGAFFEQDNVIFVQRSQLDHYLSTGVLPMTLIHELRHASFDSFKFRLSETDHAVYLPSFLSTRGKLVTGTVGHTHFVSREEAPIYFRQLRSQLARSLAILKNKLPDGPILPNSRWSALLALHTDAAQTFTTRTYFISHGLMQESTKTAMSLIDEEVEIEISQSMVEITRTSDGVKAFFPCPGCKPTRSVGKTTLDEFAKLFVESVSRDADRTPYLKAVYELIDTFAKRRIESEKGIKAPLTKGEILRVFSRSIAVLNTAKLAPALKRD